MCAQMAAYHGMPEKMQWSLFRPLGIHRLKMSASKSAMAVLLRVILSVVHYERAGLPHSGNVAKFGVSTLAADKAVE